jgi:murein DD-endopeptidase MepM/ murein hydrolase activator NlpD
LVVSQYIKGWCQFADTDKRGKMGKIKHFSALIPLVLIVLLSLSCTAIKEDRPPISNPYGGRAPYGTGEHAGIDYDIRRGTPIIASADGVVERVTDHPGERESHSGGYYVFIRHDSEVYVRYYSQYAHLSKVFVSCGHTVKRGQVIGLSGESYNGNQHLHFGLLKRAGGGRWIHNTYNPNTWGLNGEKPECFDPKKDYSQYPSNVITLPIPCREYRKILRNFDPKQDYSQYSSDVITLPIPCWDR